VASDAARLEAARPGKILREAFFTNLFNPKVALFFLAFLPQFVKPGATALSFVILGLTFVATGLAWCTLLALLSARLGDWLRRKAWRSGWTSCAVACSSCWVSISCLPA
jgi:threonine/homoserine/homoserine lactone efflux protein